MTAQPPEGPLQVQPERVIHILQERLTEEISRNALLQAGLQEAQERERSLVHALTQQRLAQEMREQAEQQRKAEGLEDTPPPPQARPRREARANGTRENQ